MNKEDIIGLELAYLGNLILTHYMIWSNIYYGNWNANIITYLTTLGGLI